MEQIRTTQADEDSSAATKYAYITRQNGVRGGNPIVAATRIGGHDVVGLLQNGETIDSIAIQSFPGLTRAQVYECLAYYRAARSRMRAFRGINIMSPA